MNNKINSIGSVFIALMLFVAPVLANPTGQQVVAGQATFSNAGATLNVNQASDRAIINWQDFSINQGELTKFLQPGTSSAVLNRVTGGNLSSILGTLQANGQVYLINPNGVVVGPSGVIDTAGFTASTLDVSNDEFLSGGNMTFLGDSTAKIQNYGAINGNMGSVFLIARQVENEGAINGQNVAIGAGTEIFLKPADGEISVQAGVEVDGTGISNKGHIQAVTAQLEAAEGNVYALAINNEGIVRASTVVNEGGKVYLRAKGGVIQNTGTIMANSEQAKGGEINIEGTFVSPGTLQANGTEGGSINVDAGLLSLTDSISATGSTGKGGSIDLNSVRTVEIASSSVDASGAEGGNIRHVAEQQISTSGNYKAIGTNGKGGNIDMSAYALKLLSADVDASGQTGGGQVRLGGEYQGGKDLATDELPNAQTLAIIDGTVVKADTLGEDGDGGTIITWADQENITLGDFSALPGTVSGDGGFMEFSAGDKLTFGATAQTGLGDRAGTVLFDPRNIYIDIAGEDVTGDTFSSLQYAMIIGYNYPDALENDLYQGLDNSDVFGISTSLDGMHLAVGAWNDDGANNATSNAGAVYLYSFTDTSFGGGSLQSVIGKGYVGGNNIDETNLQSGDNFGDAVSLDGNRLAVGAPNDDGSSNTNANAGAVYLYSFTDSSFGGGVRESIMGSGYTGGKNVNVVLNSNDGFGRGRSVALEGTQLAVGAPGDDGWNNTRTDSGAVYLYSFTDSEFNGSYLHGIIGSGYTVGNSYNLALDASDLLGMGVSLDNNRLAVGARQDDGVTNSKSNTGAVYLFTYTDDSFGGGTLQSIIGDGYTGGNNVNILLDNGDGFGNSVSMDGNRLVVNAAWDDGFSNSNTDSGAVYMYTFTNSAFGGAYLQGIIGSGYTIGDSINQALGANDSFGHSVSLDGNRLVAGAYHDDGLDNIHTDSGAVYMYTFTDSSFGGGVLRGRIGEGYSDGEHLYLDGGDRLGRAVALDGNQLAIGADLDDGFGNSRGDSGAVYLYSFTNNAFGGTTLEGVIGHGYVGGKNINQSLDGGDHFGEGLALDGNRLIVGAELDDGYGNSQGDSGAVYMYTFTDSTFDGGSLAGIIGHGYTGGNNVNLPLLGGDHFGTGVALDGNQLAVGAPYNNGLNNNMGDSGAVYMYTFTDSSFGGAYLNGVIGYGYVVGASINQSLGGGDAFGYSVALDNNRLVVGAYGDDGYGNARGNSGAVYMYTFADSSFNGGSLEGIMGYNYTGGKNVHVALDGGDQFGYGVSLEDETLVVGAPTDDGYANKRGDTGAVYIYSFTDSSFGGGSLVGNIGYHYTGGNDYFQNLDGADWFGASVSLNEGRLAVGVASCDDGFANSRLNAGGVYLYGGFGASTGEITIPFSYGLMPCDDLTISASSLEALLSSPQNVILQASNDIFVNTSITVNNPAGDGGDFTLQAGRSIFVNDNIFTDNGDLNLFANELLSAGVYDACRAAGDAVITMADGTTINAGTGNVQMIIRDGAGKTNTDSGDITIDNVIAGHFFAQNDGPSAGSDILRAQGTSMVTASSAAFQTNGGDIGTPSEPMRVTVDNLEAATNGGNAYFASPTQGLTIGGASLGGLTGINLGSGDLSISLPTGALNIIEAVSGNNVTFTADEMGIGAPLSGTGTLILQPYNTGVTMGIGTGAAGFLHWDDSELMQISGFANVYFGRANSYGDVDVHGNALSHVLGDGNVFIRTPGMGGDITFDSTINNLTWGSNTKLEAIAGRTIALHNGVLINSTGAGFGGGNAVVLRANEGGASTGDDTTAIELNNATVRSNSGGIYMVGQGMGNGTSDNSGIHLHSGAQVESTGSASVTFIGTAGADGHNNIGVHIENDGTSVAVNDGDLSIQGQGGGTGTYGKRNYGVFVDDEAEVVSNGSGELTLNGTGGNGSLFNHGVYVHNSSNISSAYGDILLLGQAGNGVNNQGAGVLFGYGSNLSSTGVGSSAANISLIGTGSDGFTERNNGVMVYGKDEVTLATGQITTVDGDITIQGQAGNGDRGDGVVVEYPLITSTGDGNITVYGQGGNDGTLGNNGTLVRNTTISSVDGNISLYGTGGDGATSQNDGLYLNNNSQIISTGSGNVFLQGTGGSNGTSRNNGIYLEGPSKVAVNNGSLTMIGQGGGNATSNSNRGIYIIAGAEVEVTGSGSISMLGTAGNGNGVNHDGILIDGSAGTKVSADNGYIGITGHGGSSTSSSHGVEFYHNAEVVSTGNGSINIKGYANSASSSGIYTSDGNNVIGGVDAKGNILLTADTMHLSDLSVQSIGDLYIRPMNTGTSIGLGNGAVGTLNLTDAEMNTFENGFNTVTVGRTDGNGRVHITNLIIKDPWNILTPAPGGDVYVDSTANIAWTTADYLQIIAGRSITVESGASITNTSNGFAKNQDVIIFRANDETWDPVGSSVGITHRGTISAKSGRIRLQGNGGITGDENYGIFFDGGHIVSTGVGSNAARLYMKGMAGKGTNDNTGTMIANGSTITTIDGSLDIRGLGGKATGSQNRGLAVVDSTIQATGSANMRFQGIGKQGVDKTDGIYFDNSTVSTNSGFLHFEGTGGNGTGIQNSGIRIRDSHLSTSASANLMLLGTGGNGTHLNNGIVIDRPDTYLTVVDGQINIKGWGGGNGTGGENMGVRIDQAHLNATGDGIIVVRGIGGNGTSYNNGVYLENAAEIHTANNGILIRGTAGGTASENHGLLMDNGASVATAGVGPGSGNIDIRGTGSGDNTGYGFFLEGAGTEVTVVDGNIYINGTGGSSIIPFIGYYYDDPTKINSTGSGSITLVGNP